MAKRPRDRLQISLLILSEFKQISILPEFIWQPKVIWWFQGEGKLICLTHLLILEAKFGDEPFNTFPETCYLNNPA